MVIRPGVDPESIELQLDDALFLEPREQFDRAIVGVASRPNLGPVVCYDVETILDVLVESEDMTREDAAEWFGYNIAETWLGEGTPVYLSRGDT